MEDFARRNHYGNLMENIVEFRFDGKYCDINIRVEERTFKCHRLILGAASKYFDCMFNGDFKESSEKEITLHHVEAAVFENVLRFVYEGDLEVINCSNVYDLICAAEFYELTMLKELCVMFVQENLNEIAKDVLKIFLFAHNTSMENLVELLSRHINENFHYFYKLPEFYELTLDQVKKVRDAIDRDAQQPVLQDAIFEGIDEWVRHHYVNLSEEERESFRRFQRRTSCNVSAECLIRSKKKIHQTQLSRESVANGDASASGSGVEKLPESLYAFISTRSTGRPSTKTSIFSYRPFGVCVTPPYFTWISSGELKRAYDFLRTIVIDDRLYSLGYYLTTHQDPEQTFMTGTSIPMYPYVSLKPPPLILDEFDMCGAGDYIYVYNKKRFTRVTIQMRGDSKFISKDQLSYGMYMYKRDADEWLPFPYPTVRFNDACMTCDEKLVYLIGGTDSRGCVQAYDVRSGGWSALPPTIGNYDSAACCVAEGNIYVAGGQNDPGLIEMYDPVSGKWFLMKRLPEMRYDKHQLLYWNSGPPHEYRGILNFSNRVSPRSSIQFYGLPNDELNYGQWWTFSHVLDFVKYKNRTLTDRINILDMVMF